MLVALPDVPDIEPAHPHPNGHILVMHETQTNSIIHGHDCLHCTLRKADNQEKLQILGPMSPAPATVSRHFPAQIAAARESIYKAVKACTHVQRLGSDTERACMQHLTTYCLSASQN